MSKPPTKPDPFALYNIIDTKPFSFSPFIKFLSKLPNPGEIELTSDYFVPPKIHENSVFVYQSVHLAEWFKALRSADWAILLAYFACCTYPLAFFVTISAHYFGWASSSLYRTANNLVIRMDVLPHIESVAFQKIMHFGRVETIIVPISELEYVPDPEPGDLLYWNSNKSSVDSKLAFRSTATDELFLFDKEGFWSEEGLKHPLIY